MQIRTEANHLERDGRGFRSVRSIKFWTPFAIEYRDENDPRPGIR